MTQRKRSVATLVRAALFAAGALYLATRPAGYAADKSDPPKAGTAGLDFVSADDVEVFSVHFADLWEHPLGKSVRARLMKAAPELLTHRNPIGVAPDDIDRISFVVRFFGAGGEPLLVVTTLKPCDKKTILWEAPDAKEIKVYGRSFYDSDGHSIFYSLAFLDEHTFLMGISDCVAYYLRDLPAIKKDGAMAPVFRLASHKHLIAAGLDIAALAMSGAPQNFLPLLPLQRRSNPFDPRSNPFDPPRLDRGAPESKLPPPLRPLLKAQVATLAVDLDDQLKADLRVTFATEGDAKDAVAAVDAYLDQVRSEFADGVKLFTHEVDAPKAAAILRDAQAALKAAKAEQKGTTVEVEVALKLDPNATADALAEAVEKIQKAGKGGADLDK